MIFEPSHLSGAWLIQLEPRRDERGLFCRTWCDREFSAHSLNTCWPQANTTRTFRAGTIRGLHWQAEPHPEIKLVRCSAGAIWDVIVDIRPESPSFGRWAGFELTAENFRQVYVPAGFAHGFQALTDQAEVSYLMSEFYFPEQSRGCRWDDEQLNIRWPLPPENLSERDRHLPRWSEL